MGRKLGEPDDPLLVSVRSGREVLDARDDGDGPQHRPQRRVGRGPGRSESGSERFAWDSYRRLIQMFGKTVLDIDATAFDDALDAAQGTSAGVDDRRRAGRRRPARAGRRRTRRSSASTPAGTSRRTRASSCDLAIGAVFASWNTERAVLYRRQERIPDDLGTAVNVWPMVFGNLGPDSGTGVVLHPRPGDRRQGVYGDYLPNAQGEDVVAGIRNTVPLADLEGIDKPSYDELLTIMATLGAALPRPVRHRVHRRARQAVDAADPGRQADRRRRRSGSPSSWSTRALIDADEALRRVTGDAAGPADVPAVRPDRRPRAADHRRSAPRPARPPAGSLFDSATAVAWADRGRRRWCWSAGRPTPTTCPA